MHVSSSSAELQESSQGPAKINYEIITFYKHYCTRSAFSACGTTKKMIQGLDQTKKVVGDFLLSFIMKIHDVNKFK